VASEFLAVEQLKKLPYLGSIPRDGRTVPLLTFYEPAAADWHLYLRVRPGELGRIAGGEPVSGSYFAANAVDLERDFEFALGTLIAQRMSFLDILEQLNKLESGVHRCSAVLEKYRILWTTKPGQARSASLLIQSELEYLLLLLRSVYDTLQVIVQAVTKKLIIRDGLNTRASKNLPKSFRDVVMKGDHVLTVDEVQSRWRMPRPLADWYVQEATFFRLLRSLRDGIAHEGIRPPTVFETEWGFAIATDERPWTQVAEWVSTDRWNGSLASLRSLFVEFVFHTLRATSRFGESIESFVQLPEPILGNVKYFVRSPFGSHLVSLERIRGQPWENRTG